jgi:uncharacterized protein DUF4349
MAYLDGELSPDRAATAAGHQQRCRGCQDIAADLQGVSRQLRVWRVDSPAVQIDDALAAALAEPRQIPKRRTSSGSKWIIGLVAALRVPADQLAPTVAEIKGLGRVEAESQGGEEVTSQYIGIDARLTNARNTEQRLTDLLRQRTGKLADVLAVELELGPVRGEIERMEAENKSLINPSISRPSTQQFGKITRRSFRWVRFPCSLVFAMPRSKAIGAPLRVWST